MSTKWRTLWLLSFLILGSYGKADAVKKRVCIVGMGITGIAALKQVAMHPEELEPIVFEKRSDVGGLWTYTESTTVDEFGMPIRSNMYKYLRTNGPKDLMVFPDYTNFLGENRSYPTHMDVLRYLQNYTEHFNLYRHIQFNVFVEKVTALSNTPDTQWNLTTRNLKTNKYSETICDSVMVCNGHYSKHYVPELPGLETFPGPVFHSIYYREPQRFAGKKVVVLGSGSSGTDIALQISWFADKVFLSHRNKLGVEIPKNMEEVAAVVSINGSQLTLSDGQILTADAFILCTGYEYNLPFLGEDSGIEVIEGKYIRPLYKHFVNIEHPTMAFIGLQFPSIPFVIAYVQAQYYTSVLLGKTKLPSRDDMLQDSQLPPGVPMHRAHFLADGAVDYHDDLARYANLDLLGDTVITRIFRYWVADKKNDLLHFKDKDVVVYEDGSVEMQRQYYPIFGLDYMDEKLTIY